MTLLSTRSVRDTTGRRRTDDGWIHDGARELRRYASPNPIDVDNLLALMGFDSSVNAYQPFANFMDLFRLKGRISEDGLMLENGDVQLAAKLEYAAKQLLSIVDARDFAGFKIPDALKEN
jgi:hypothetical protein